MSYQQHNPPHPGELIQRTYIDPFEKLTSNGIADELGVVKSHRKVDTDCQIIWLRK